MKEDVDFMLQRLTAGWSNITVNKFAMNKPAMGSTSGGLSRRYAANENSACAHAIAEEWPDILTLKRKRGGWDVRVNWSAFPSTLNLVGDSLPLTVGG